VLGSVQQQHEISVCDDEETYIYKMYDPTDPNDESLGWYDWLADSVTTSHICNDHKLFTMYQPEKDAAVAGAGNNKMTVEGRGTVDLIVTHNGHAYSMNLTNVLHVPTNRNNLLSLGRLDAAGGHYSSANGILTLTSANCKPIAEGRKVSNNLYKMRVVVRKNVPTNAPKNGLAFEASDVSQTWETWHKHYCHGSWTGSMSLSSRYVMHHGSSYPMMPLISVMVC
jgi:hypothetical protein